MQIPLSPTAGFDALKAAPFLLCLLRFFAAIPLEDFCRKKAQDAHKRKEERSAPASIDRVAAPPAQHVKGLI